MIVNFFLRFLFVFYSPVLNISKLNFDIKGLGINNFGCYGGFIGEGPPLTILLALGPVGGLCCIIGAFEASVILALSSEASRSAWCFNFFSAISLSSYSF